MSVVRGGQGLRAGVLGGWRCSGGFRGIAVCRLRAERDEGNLITFLGLVLLHAGRERAREGGRERERERARDRERERGRGRERARAGVKVFTSLSE